jgi:hypothetical protein
VADEWVLLAAATPSLSVLGARLPVDCHFFLHARYMELTDLRLPSASALLYLHFVA